MSVDVHGSSLCFLYGLCFALLLSKVTSKNLQCSNLPWRWFSGQIARKFEQFEQFDLKITAKVNLNIVNFLDVTFDLNNAKHKPYRKPNDDPLYINRHSNHPPSITRQLPTAINKRTVALKHLRNLRLFTRTPLDIVTLIMNLRTLRMHLNGRHVRIGNATY
jgi:hypothetical protein